MISALTNLIARSFLVACLLILPAVVGRLSALEIVFDSTNQAISGATSNSDLAAIWGDAVRLVNTGTLSSLKFTIFCSGTSAADLVSATVNFNFYNFTGGTIGNSLGGFAVNIGSISKGSYSDYTFTNLESTISNPINLSVTDIFITQRLTNVVGATRMGTALAFSNTPAVGANLTNGFYLSSSTNTAGWYLINGQTYSNMIYQIATIPVPEPSTSVLVLASLVTGFTSQRIKRKNNEAAHNRCQA